jgi:hypothetical protein
MKSRCMLLGMQKNVYYVELALVDHAWTWCLAVLDIIILYVSDSNAPQRCSMTQINHQEK